MMSQSVPLDMVQMAGRPSGVMPAGGFAVPNGSSQVVRASYAPDGGISPPGVPFSPACGPMTPGAVAAVGALPGGVPSRFPTQRTSVRFLNPAGMKISWYSPNGMGQPGLNAVQLEAPGRYNFVQAAIYRLKLGNIPNRPGLELYPTLEVLPTTWRTESFLAHSAVPVTFTDEDFEQVAAGNFLVKVIYLPDPQFQEVATTGPGEVVSTRLDPGVDPIAEARRRGNILLVVRLGNIDLEAPNTPAMDAPSPYMLKAPMPKSVGLPIGRGNSGPAGAMGPMGPMPLPATGGPVSPYGPVSAPGTNGMPTMPPLPVGKLPDARDVKTVSGPGLN
jgi:hypothetical protein